jgi:hypothetical protein
MADQERLRERVAKMRSLIRIGRERIAGHSPVWAAYLASETLRSIDEVLDEMDEEMHSTAGAGDDKRYREAV